MGKYLKELISEPKRVKKYLIIIAVVVFVFACIIVYFSDSIDQKVIVPEVTKADNVEKVEEPPVEEASKGEIIVDVGGAVVSPGVYTLSAGSRVFEALDAAGGLSNDANTKDINQAAEMADGDRIYVPTTKEVTDGYVGSSDAGVVSGGSQSNSGNIPGGSSKVNINTADSVGLQVLSGVGPATAEKIIDYRNANGKFTSIEKLKNVSGIGEKTYEKLKDKICV